MAAGAQPDLSERALSDHPEPWTEENFLALPADRRRLELLDGGILVSPSAGGRHQWLSSQLWLALSRAAPERFQVLEAINIRVAPGKILIPDLAVVTNPGADLTVWEPTDVAMLVEITSPGSVAFDRAIKPELYARARISRYLRVELTEPDPTAVGYRLEHDRYAEVRRAGPGQLLLLEEPFGVDLDLAALATATRPPV